jgi:hypothetical protein
MAASTSEVGGGQNLLTNLSRSCSRILHGVPWNIKRTRIKFLSETILTSEECRLLRCGAV